MDISPDLPVIGFIGRLEEQKGVDILMEAIPRLAAAGNAQVLLITISALLSFALFGSAMCQPVVCNDSVNHMECPPEIRGMNQKYH